MSNSQIMSGKGLGVDYSGSIRNFAVGLGAGVAVDTGASSIEDVIGGAAKAEDIKGFGLQSALMFGWKFKKIENSALDIEDLAVFVHFFHAPFKKTSIQLESDMTSFGFHFQKNIVPPKSTALGFIRWGGIAMTTGVEAAFMKIEKYRILSENLSRNVTISEINFNSQISLNFIGKTTLGLDTASYSFPINFSTNLQVFWLLTFFGGIGADVNYGKTKSYGNLEGNLLVTSTHPVLSPITASAELNVDSGGHASLSDANWFAGLQINQSFLKTYLQLNKSFLKNLWGVGLGLRFIL